MTATRNTSIADTQIGLLVRYVLRARWAIPATLIAAVIAAVATELYRRATQSTTYVSETVAVVRPQAAFKINAHANVINYLNNPDKEAEFLPEPLSVVDYALIIKTQDVLEAVATRYNEQHGEGAVSVGALRSYLQPVTKLELGSMGTPPKVDVDGKQVFLCCEGCRERLLADPDKYLANLEQQTVVGGEGEDAAPSLPSMDLPPIGPMNMIAPPPDSPAEMSTAPTEEEMLR